jgi:hypothetical protein
VMDFKATACGAPLYLQVSASAIHAECRGIIADMVISAENYFGGRSGGFLKSWHGWRRKLTVILMAESDLVVRVCLKFLEAVQRNCSHTLEPA